MLRKLLILVLLPPLLICAAVLVIIGLKDLDLLVAIVSKLLVVAVIIGIPVILIKMTDHLARKITGAAVPKCSARLQPRAARP